MPLRPSDLPDFTDPPVTEVVVGVQFNGIAGFLAPHLGLIWEEFRADFPYVEEQIPLGPTFETFGPNPGGYGSMPFAFPNMFGMPRVLFINADKTQLLQVQKDRFLHNWRKVGEGDKYPRFEGMLQTFEDGVKKLAAVIRSAHLGELVPNQCEVSYINHIKVEGDRPFDTIEQAFGEAMGTLTLDDLGRPEDTRFLLRYVMHNNQEVPIGRLVINAEPGVLANGSAVVQLTLTARGIPQPADIDGVSQFLQRGRQHIVRAFAKLTSEKMQQKWGRKQ
jgi:uncharacterized protein (TIGR04255 family)